MRDTRAIVNDVTRAMRRAGKRLCPKLAEPPANGYGPHEQCQRAAGALLLNYAAMLKAATSRQPKRRKR